MFKYILIAALCAGATCGQPFDIIEDESGNQFYLLPINNIGHKRETTGAAGPNGATVTHKQTIINNENHKVDATAYAQRNYHPKGPLTTGNQFDYHHKPSDSVLSIQTENTRGYGTDATAKGTYNFFRTPDKQGTVGVSGTYNQHFGGRMGNRQAGYGVLLHGRYDF